MGHTSATMSLPESTNQPLSFDQFEQGYNYADQFRYNQPFFRILKDEVARRQGPVTLLDIGCGTGIGRNVEMQRELRKLAGTYWGVEPDTGVQIEDGIFDHVHRALLEDADVPENSVDIAYAFMVMEHVVNPEGFLEKINKVLKPGGLFIFCSPNKHSFFGRLAYWTDKLKVADLLLGMLHSEDTLEHHYALAYKINTASDINKHARANRLTARVGYCEHTNAMRNYLKGPLKLLGLPLAAKRKLIKKPASLCHIYGYIEKPGE